MTKELLKLSDIKIEKMKFQCSIVDNVDIKKCWCLISLPGAKNKEVDTINFIGHKKGEKIRPL